MTEPQMTSSTDTDSELGRLLVRRRGAAWRAVVTCLLALVFVFGTVFIACTVKPSDAWVVLLVGAGAAAWAYGAYVTTVHGLTTVSVYENGVTQRGPGGDVRMLYVDVASFVYELTRHYTNFAYGGTTVEFAVVSASGVRIHLEADYQERRESTGRLFESTLVSADCLDELRQRISVILANRFLAELSSGGHVALGRDLEFSLSGLTPLTGARKGHLVRWDALERVHIDKGILRIFETGHRRAISTVVLSSENAWPFYVVLLTLAPHLTP